MQTPCVVRGVGSSSLGIESVTDNASSTAQVVRERLTVHRASCLAANHPPVLSDLAQLFKASGFEQTERAAPKHPG